MARGRVITPDFWSDGNMVGVSAFARLFYIGMWNFAHCDKGHLDDDAMGLKLKILPADHVDPQELLAELTARERVTRLRADSGKTFLFIPTFARWQKSDPRWKTRCPACALINSGELSETPVSLGEPSETPLSSALREEKRTRENQREEIKDFVQGKPAPDYESEFAQWWVSYPRKQGRAPALKSFKRIRKTVPLKTLMDGVQAYALLSAGVDKQLIKLPAGWLNDARWEDEQIVNSTRTTTTNQPAECSIHRNYPLPCDACARDANEGREF